MGLKGLLAGIGCGLLLTAPAAAQGPADTPASPEPPRPAEVPRIAPAPASAQYWYGPFAWQVILDYRQQLGLSAAQVESLERLGTDFIREAIRRQAELSLAQVDLAVLLGSDPEDLSRPVELAKAESKIGEIERVKTELQIAHLGAVEASKAQLTADQRSKLATLLTQDAGEAMNPGTTPRGGSAGHPGTPPGAGGRPGPSPGAGGRPGPPPGAAARPGPPPGGAVHPGVPPRPRFESHRGFDRGVRGRVVIGVGPLWWGPYWSFPPSYYVYAPPPVIVQEPPTYIQQPPAYWYYCASAQAYYPSVQTCPEGWITVLPRPD